MKRKYPLWGQFIKASREAKYRSAREFCARVEIGISYPQYSRYEAGEQLPSLDQALSLFRCLGVPALEGMLIWNRSQLAEDSLSAQVDALIEQVRGGVGWVTPGAVASFASPSVGPDEGAAAALPTQAPGAPSAGSVVAGGSSVGAGVKLDEVIVFNRSHLRMFGSDPVYRDIFTYINSYAPDAISADEIAAAMEIPRKKLMGMLEELHDHGVIDMDGDACRASKRIFYFPDDEDFFPMRNLNFVHNVSNIMRGLSFEQLSSRRAYRGLITRELTPSQLEALIHRLDSVVKDVVEQPETGEPQKIYSLCVALGERFDRARVLPAMEPLETRPGLTLSHSAASPDELVGAEDLALDKSGPRG